jgi:hypothetical protein
MNHGDMENTEDGVAGELNHHVTSVTRLFSPWSPCLRG